MAAAASNHSARSSGSVDLSAALNSLQSKREMAARGGAAPWPQIVRGIDSESFVAVEDAPSSPSASGAFRGPIKHCSSDRLPSKAAASSSSSSSLSLPDQCAGEAQGDYPDNGAGSNNAAKKQVWNKPSNGTVAVEVGPVMGADSWPPLSESTRAPPKSVSSDSFKPISDPLVPASPGTGVTFSTTQNLVVTNNASPAVMSPTRQKSMKKGAGSSSGSVTANGSLPQVSTQLGPVVEMLSNNAGRSGLAVLESSPRDHTNKESGRRGGFGSQSHGGNDHPQQRNSFRRGNGGGSYPRGDGSYHQNYRVRRDQDGGNHEWNSHRSFNGRDAHIHSQRVVPRGFMRPSPHTSTPFMPPPPPVPVQPFGSHIIYPDMPSPVIYVPAPPPDSFRGVPVVAQMPHHAMFFPMPDQLRLKIMSQIDYYFSNENLIRDTYLRQNMDEQGWVSINLIAGFAKVKLLTDSVPLILDALRFSNIVEVKDEKVRKRDDWWRWIMPFVQFPNVSSPQSVARSSHDMLSAKIQTMSLEEKMNKQGKEDGGF